MRPDSSRGRPAARSLIPREHGAYAQLVLPQLAVLCAARLTLGAVLMCASAALAFVSHESLMVASGARGTRALREEGQRARRTLSSYGLVGAALGLAGASLLAPNLRITLVPPLVLGALALLASARLGPRSLLSQLASSAAFACIVLPVGVVGGLPLRSAVIHSVVWLTVFLISTLMARTLAHREERSRRFLVAVSAAFILGVAWALVGARVPMPAALALTPACVACVAVALRPPSPTKLRAVGWTLVATSTFTAAALAVGVGIASP